MPQYIEQLNECTDPVSDDWMWVVDVSAASNDKDRKLSVGRMMLRNSAGHGQLPGTRIIGVDLPTYNNGQVLTIDITAAITRAVVMDISIASQRSGGTAQFAILRQTVGFRSMGSGQNAIISGQSTIINVSDGVTIAAASVITNGIRITLTSTSQTMDRNSLTILASTSVDITVTTSVA